ncbi:MAG TPA: hypothetical protein VF762_17615, partial [Blastocatellia bacterium]
EKDPALRPQSAGELARQFEEAAGLGQPAQAGAGRAAFSRISVPLGEEDPPLEVAPRASGPDTLDDEATLVRPRAGRASGAPLDTPAFQIAETPLDQRSPTARAASSQDGALNDSGELPPNQVRYSTPAEGTIYVSHPSDHGRRGNTGGIIALVAVVLLVAGVAAYLTLGNKLFGSGSTSEAVIEAQQAVTDALARVDMLPKDHSLRTYISDLRQWQGELKAYQEIKENNPQVTDKADRYRQKAEDISNQARAALAALGREPANTSPVQTSPNTNAPPAKEAGAAASTGSEGAAGGGKSDAEAGADTKSEREGENETENTNRAGPRKAEPPLIDPVKPDPDKADTSDAKPKNSNSSRGKKPPIPDNINANGNPPTGAPPR